LRRRDFYLVFYNPFLFYDTLPKAKMFFWRISGTRAYNYFVQRKIIVPKKLAGLPTDVCKGNPEIYRDYPRPPSQKNILTVHRETPTQYITFKR
jgi:hypothetical protein